MAGRKGRLWLASASAAAALAALWVLLAPRRETGGRRWVGLANRGNTCYLNSILHALASLDLPIAESRPFARTLARLLRILSRPRRDGPVLSAGTIAGCLGANGLPQDAHAALLRINALLRDGRGPALTPLEGLAAAQLRCPRCGQEGMLSIHPFVTLTLAGAGASTQELLQSSPEPAVVSSPCAHCHSPDRRLSSQMVWRAPPALILHVSRPTQPSARVSLRTATGSTAYVLRATVSHHGTDAHGHYTCERLVGGRWILFSDESVVSDVDPPTRALLFYRRGEVEVDR